MAMDGIKSELASKAAYVAALIGLCSSIAQATTNDKCILKDGITFEQSRNGLCGFDPVLGSFKGTAAEQAKCLTRQVLKYAQIGEPTLPPSFLDRVGNNTVITLDRLSNYLNELGVPQQNVGGPIGVPVAARYFIIHDTSTPNCSVKSTEGKLAFGCPEWGVMPAARDTANWSPNHSFLGHPKNDPDRLANIITNRVGGSITEVDLASPMFTTTKFEKCADRDRKAGLFVAIENIQPRIGDPARPAKGIKPNDPIAPTPGFTLSQYDRLALIYVVASIRQGRWMIPAFHAVLDSNYKDVHDDPQNFETQKFASAVERHIAALSAQ